MNLVRAIARISAMATCTHGNFEYISAMGKTVVGKCRKCKSHVAASPGSIHYEKIMAAKKRKRRG